MARGNFPILWSSSALKKVFIHSTGCLGRREKKKEKKGNRERLWKSSTFSLPYIDFTACGCVKLLRCNPQIVFLIRKWLFVGYMVIGFQYIYIIYGAVFVVENAIFCKKMNSAWHSHCSCQLLFVQLLQYSEILKYHFVLFVVLLCST